MSKLTHGEKCEQVYEREADVRGKGRGMEVGVGPEGRVSDGEKQRDGDRQQEIVAVLAYWPLCFRLFIRVKISTSTHLIPRFQSPCLGGSWVMGSGAE